MSHTFEWDGMWISYNGDYSGEVEIVAGSLDTSPRVTVPFDMLKEFVANYVRLEKISDLENTSAETVLLGRPIFVESVSRPEVDPDFPPSPSNSGEVPTNTGPVRDAIMRLVVKLLTAATEK